LVPERARLRGGDPVRGRGAGGRAVGRGPVAVRALAELVRGAGAGRRDRDGRALRRVAWMALWLLACSQPGAGPDPLAGVGDPAVVASDPVVARVNGKAIVASEVAARQRARDAGAVLDDLVLEDLLAEEAKRQGLLQDVKARDAAHRAMSRRVIGD